MNPIVEKAKLFAEVAHGDQRYGDFPYTKHLQDVVNVLEEFEDDPYVLAAGWMHDTIEDTAIDFTAVFNEFGRVVARLVYAVSNEPGKNRKERHERTYPKMIAAGRNAIAIKLADRIANTENCMKFNHHLFKMYEREYPGFKKTLQIPGELKFLWARLDVLMEHKVED